MIQMLVDYYGKKEIFYYKLLKFVDYHLFRLELDL